MKNCQFLPARSGPLLLLLLLICPEAAHAYVDPGSGSLVLQAIIGVVFTLGITLKHFGKGLLSLLKLRKTDNSDENGNEHRD